MGNRNSIISKRRLFFRSIIQKLKKVSLMKWEYRKLLMELSNLSNIWRVSFFLSLWEEKKLHKMLSETFWKNTSKKKEDKS